MGAIASRLCDKLAEGDALGGKSCLTSNIFFSAVTSLDHAIEEVDRYKKDFELCDKQALFAGFDLRDDIEALMQIRPMNRETLLSSVRTYFVKIEKFVSLIRAAGFNQRIHIVLASSTCDLSSQDQAAYDIATQLSMCSETLRDADADVFDLNHLSAKCLDLHPRDRNFNAVQEAISQVFLNVLDQDFTNNYSRFHIGSCALVSTAGYLRKFNNGGNIDKATYVVRSGTGGTHGFEDMVGTRTDLRIVRHSVFHAGRGSGTSHLDPEVTIVVHDNLEKTTNPLRDHKQAGILFKRPLPYYSFHRWHNSELTSRSRIGTCLNVKRDLSSGLWSHLLLLHELELCSKITLYGFLGHVHPGEPYHYYTMGLHNENITTSLQYASRNSTRRGHNFANEQKCLMDAADRVDIRKDLMEFEISR